MTDPLPQFDLLHGYLPPGWHPADPARFRQRCVEELAELIADPASIIHRDRLFSGYMRLHEALEQLGIPTEQWIGGSYVSRKDRPGDIDLVNFCDAQTYEALPPALRALVNGYFRGPETAKHCHCDSYFVSKGPPDHPCNADYLLRFAYWKKLLGHDRRGQPKGLIGVTIEPPPPPDSTHDAAA